MGNPAEIIEFQKKQEAKFICSACGADRACNCNAPALEKLAELKEQNRQRQARHAEKKREQKQQSPNVRAPSQPSWAGEEITIGDDLEPDEFRGAFLLRAADALSFAVYSGEVDNEVIAAAERVAAKWNDFAQTLKAKYGNQSFAPDDLSIPPALRRSV
jgi:hypothetical protein